MAGITEHCLELQVLDPIILFQAADGQMTLDIWLEDDTVWLSQAQMAELFRRERSVISKQIGNVFREGELAARVIHRQVDFYSLDGIISVGCPAHCIVT